MFDVCWNDQHCKKHGENYACFQYICLKLDLPNDPRYNDSVCQNDNDCNGIGKCYRHQNEEIAFGVCFGQQQTCGGLDGSCLIGQECCDGICCQEIYYEKYAALSCRNDEECQKFGIESICCEGKGEDGSNICCKEDWLLIIFRITLQMIEFLNTLEWLLSYNQCLEIIIS